jgi:hypothetical protein
MYLVDQAVSPGMTAISQTEMYVTGGGVAVLVAVVAAIAYGAQNSESGASQTTEVDAAVPTPKQSPAPAPAATTAAKAPQVQAVTLKTEAAPKSDADLARVYDKSREEVQEIARIKNDFIAKLEKAGRQSTLRLQTMGGTPIEGVEGEEATAEASESSAKGDSLPDELLVRVAPMNLAKRNAIEANRKQWGIGYDPEKPERMERKQTAAK